MNTKTIDTVLSVIAAIISLVGLGIGVAIMMGYESWVDFAVTFTIALLLVAAGAALLFAIVSLVTNLKGNLSLIASIVGFVIVGFICYTLADGEVLQSYAGISSETSKLSGAGIYLMYVLIIGAVASIIVGEATRLFK